MTKSAEMWFFLAGKFLQYYYYSINSYVILVLWLIILEHVLSMNWFSQFLHFINLSKIIMPTCYRRVIRGIDGYKLCVTPLELELNFRLYSDLCLTWKFCMLNCGFKSWDVFWILRSHLICFYVTISIHCYFIEYFGM